MLIINVHVCSAALSVFPPGVLKVKIATGNSTTTQQVTVLLLTLIQLIQTVAYLIQNANLCLLILFFIVITTAIQK